jgi:hypothetical protein
MRFESQLKHDYMMAKNEIKMLLLGAGRLVVLLCLCFKGNKLTLSLVDRTQANETYSSWRLQQIET